MNDETTLIPCPWCSEYPKIAEDGGSTGPWFCVWHDCPPVEGGKARHYGESLGCISITTAWFHTEAEAIAAWNTRAELGSGTCKITATATNNLMHPDYMTKWYELSCGHSLTLKGDEAPKWCAVCGKAVER